MTTTVARRLSPALIKGTKIFIQCPEWCTVDHVAANENHIEDVWHAGEYADLNVPQMNGNPELLVFARIGIDEQSDDPGMRNAFLFVDDGNSGFYMTPEQAVDFADNLHAFAARVRGMAKQAKEDAK